MKNLIVLASLGLLSVFNVVAQDRDVYQSDRRYCGSGRSGMDFNSCMRQLQHDRERDRDRYERREYDRRQQWEQPPPPVYRQQQEQPRLSDMQQRALDNCALLAPREQPRCRATVMSTVR